MSLVTINALMPICRRFSSGDGEYLRVGDRRVPYAVFDNEPEKTDDPERLGPHLEEVCGRLWSIRQGM